MTTRKVARQLAKALVEKPVPGSAANELARLNLAVVSRLARSHTNDELAILYRMTTRGFLKQRGRDEDRAATD